MVAPVIIAKGLKKRFDNVVAVNGIDFEVKKGEIFGLVGADGAGKTTTIKMLCTLALPSEGEARVLGRDTVTQAAEIRQKSGYMSEIFNLYPTLSVEENLDFFARLRNVPSDIAEARKKELLGFCRLEPHLEGRAAGWGEHRDVRSPVRVVGSRVEAAVHQHPLAPRQRDTATRTDAPIHDLPELALYGHVVRHRRIQVGIRDKEVPLPRGVLAGHHLERVAGALGSRSAHSATDRVEYR